MIKETNPAHYTGAGGIEAIDVIDAYDLNFNLGNAIKYILRAGKKDDAMLDLSKAIWYLQHESKKYRRDSQLKL